MEGLLKMIKKSGAVRRIGTAERREEEAEMEPRKAAGATDEARRNPRPPYLKGR